MANVTKWSGGSAIHPADDRYKIDRVEEQLVDSCPAPYQLKYGVVDTSHLKTFFTLPSFDLHHNLNNMMPWKQWTTKTPQLAPKPPSYSPNGKINVKVDKTKVSQL